MEGSMTTAEPSIFRWLSPKQSPATPVSLILPASLGPVNKMLKLRHRSGNGGHSGLRQPRLFYLFQSSGHIVIKPPPKEVKLFFPHNPTFLWDWQNKCIARSIIIYWNGNHFHQLLRLFPLGR